MSALVPEAASNNAQWVDAVCRGVGLPVAMSDRLWWTTGRSPDGYPEAVTLEPGVAVDDIVSRISTSTGCSVKDSFADLDLAPSGFRVLFDASWVRRGPGRPDAVPALDWAPVDSPAGLAAWARGHGGASALGLDLVGPDIRLLACHRDGQLVGGAALSLTGAVLGVSNVFVLEASPVEVWDDVVTMASRLFPAMPLVGYERGEELEFAVAAGFSPMGPLRIWML